VLGDEAVEGDAAVFSAQGEDVPDIGDHLSGYGDGVGLQEVGDFAEIGGLAKDGTVEL
jgi:hypothetical protein